MQFALLVFEHGSLIGTLIGFAPDLATCLDKGAAKVAADASLAAWVCPAIAAG